MLKNRLKSFSNAFNGLGHAVAEEVNFRIHLVMAMTVIGLGLYLDISRIEWILLVVAIGIVLLTELFNTALENLCDLVNNEHDPVIGKIKDISAGAVLVSAIISSIIGTIIFLPYLIKITKNLLL